MLEALVINVTAPASDAAGMGVLAGIMQSTTPFNVSVCCLLNSRFLSVIEIHPIAILRCVGRSFLHNWLCTVQEPGSWKLDLLPPRLRTNFHQ